MPSLDHSKLSIREMNEDESEMVLEMLKDGFRDTENRLILHIITRPLALLCMAVVSSALRFLINSFIAALLVPVLLAVIGLKLLLWRSQDLRRLYSYYSAAGRKIWVVFYDEDDLCGCIAMDPKDDGETVELKRMSVSRWYRRSGIGTFLLKFFENSARRMGFRRVILYTSVVTKAAIALYTNNGYSVSGGVSWLGYTVVEKYTKELKI
ncbi:N-acetyltransferase 14 [Protopterus annectens]|uniref:N-acetyltransferase 14 n=1 Tax=Protopterus annectens TaxID=7888 RepID=UPI001CFBC960|nr:N-acetyltransferase 14 [Protopterus annectens]